MYESLTELEFEDSWNAMIYTYERFDNEWLRGLYDKRNRWVLVFVKNVFQAGMSTTQQSESMHAVLTNTLMKTTLKQFVEQYDKALKDKYEKENRTDSDSFNSMRPCITDYHIKNNF